MSTRTLVTSGIAIVALAGTVFLLREHVTRLDEEIVYAHYQKNINALRRFDARTMCGMLHPDYHAVDTSTTPAGVDRLELDKQKACEGMAQSMTVMRQVVEVTKAAPDLKYTIESVELSPDRKQATVRLRMSMRIGKRFSAASTGSETLVRRMGRVLVTGSETRTTVSVR